MSEVTPRPPVALIADRFPELSETFVVSEARALADLGHPVLVVACSAAEYELPGGADGLEVRRLEDHSAGEKLRSLAWLALRHPLRCLGDLWHRRRWRRAEHVRRLAALAPVARRLAAMPGVHLHAHFAAGAALDALRLHRLLGLPYSVTAHAYDIFRAPANLEEKLATAAFATTGCEYNRRHLLRLAPAAAQNLYVIVMGVDPQRFRRRAPAPGTGVVVAVGRLVEKKGFADLIDAAALLRERGAPVERVEIVGEGRLRAALEQRIAQHGLGAIVRLAGALAPDAVRATLEAADLLAMPCVVAADGDRDSMPVVVKEALAMELPVVATDEVGLPELVRPEWGRLVAPRDPGALAAALADLLALEPADRARMGAVGRAHVLAACDVRAETAKLSDLIVAAADAR